MNTKEYKYIEYTDDNDYTIANVVMDEDKIVSVKLTEDCLTNKTEYIDLLQFLDEIKTMPWKYDDNEQACEAWYGGYTLTHEDLPARQTPGYGYMPVPGMPGCLYPESESMGYC